jgi:hypothetical protein
MKVFELIDILNKCAPDADVTCAFASADPTEGSEVKQVLEIRYITDNFTNSVILRY